MMPNSFDFQAFKIRLPSWTLYIILPYCLIYPANPLLLCQRMQTDPPAGVSASPVADNVMTW